MLQIVNSTVDGDVLEAMDWKLRWNSTFLRAIFQWSQNGNIAIRKYNGNDLHAMESNENNWIISACFFLVGTVHMNYSIFILRAQFVHFSEPGTHKWMKQCRIAIKSTEYCSKDTIINFGKMPGSTASQKFVFPGRKKFKFQMEFSA